MKKIGILLVIIFLTKSSFCQLFKIDTLGFNYFNKGTNLLEIGDYIKADSLFSLALCSYKNQNVYFNRALSRLLKTDTLGYCRDMNIAANKYFDPQAEKLYNSTCCKKIDTIYYDKDFIETDPPNHRYFEIIKHPLYDTLIYGFFHDIKSKKVRSSADYGCDNSLIGINLGSTNMIANYVIRNTIKYYISSTKSISIYDKNAYRSLKERAEKLLQVKYQNIKSENDADKLKIFFKVYFNEHGDVIEVSYLGFYPKIGYNKDISELEKDLLDIAKHYPKVKPAKFFKEKVCFTAYDYVEF